MYEINTVVNKVIDQKVNYKLFTVLILVDSYSNILPLGTPVCIENLSQFNLYFPDSLKDRDRSLNTAFKLLSSGYRLIVINVHDCKNRETVRVFNDGSNNWYDYENDFDYIKTNLVDEDYLAVSFDANELIENSYILFEHIIRGVSSNKLIYTTSEVPLNAVNYMTGYTYYVDPNLSLEDKIERLTYILRTKFNYIVSVDKDGHTIHIAYPCEFRSITNTKNVELKYDKIFQLKYKNAIRDKEKLFDIASKYNSDINDLKIKILIDDIGAYKLYVYKYYNGSNISTCEIFSDDTFDELIFDVYQNSKFIELKAYSDHLISGEFILTNIYEPSKCDINNYINAIECISEYKDTETKYEFDTNLVYEPDLDTTKENKYLIQLLLANTFDKMDNPIIKVMDYLNVGGEENFINTAFVNSYDFIYNNLNYNSKELYLTLLINNEFNKSHDDIKFIDYEFKDVPDYVNSPIKNMKTITFNNMICKLNKNLFKITDILLISTINYLLNSSREDKTKYLIYDIIELVTEFYTQNLGYNPKISLSRLEKHDDILEIDLEYYLVTINKIEMLNLVLDID